VDESSVNGRTTALERRRRVERQIIGDPVHKALRDDSPVAKSSLVRVGVAVHLSLWALGVLAPQADVALLARPRVVAKANSVSGLVVCHFGAYLRDDTDWLVAQDLGERKFAYVSGGASTLLVLSNTHHGGLLLFVV
jgi:hypothetical protein